MMGGVWLCPHFQTAMKKGVWRYQIMWLSENQPPTYIQKPPTIRVKSRRAIVNIIAPEVQFEERKETLPINRIENCQLVHHFLSVNLLIKILTPFYKEK